MYAFNTLYRRPHAVYMYSRSANALLTYYYYYIATYNMNIIILYFTAVLCYQKRQSRTGALHRAMVITRRFAKSQIIIIVLFSIIY